MLLPPDILNYMCIIQNSVLSGGITGFLMEKYFLIVQFRVISAHISFLAPISFLKEIDGTAMSLW